jgi:hypothetical protein
MIRRHGWWIKAHEINCAIFLIYCTRILQERKTSKRMIEEGERKKRRKKPDAKWVGG